MKIEMANVTEQAKAIHPPREEVHNSAKIAKNKLMPKKARHFAFFSLNSRKRPTGINKFKNIARLLGCDKDPATRCTS